MSMMIAYTVVDVNAVGIYTVAIICIMPKL